ncbi:hypothetical protein QO004_002936 [Rhizobium mesoamericanum]|uniref:hypothetical protein n=1 Tax=Rhizobium mesoamericanum TaxID=1079800 RepID=UPI00277D84B2|nr:hypothetical protein [Rhizobium mesoamericanum]MDQ0561143.1 hypothetical protein [Rhizobium mesoamericanum]
MRHVLALDFQKQPEQVLGFSDRKALLRQLLNSGSLLRNDELTAAHMPLDHLEFGFDSAHLRHYAPLYAIAQTERGREPASTAQPAAHLPTRSTSLMVYTFFSTGPGNRITQ